MKKAKYLILLLLLLLAVAYLAIRGTDKPRPSLAILDFTMIGNRPIADDWSIGLTGYSAFLLEKRGVATLPRRELGYVLSAMGSTESGPIEIEQAIRSRFPRIKFALKGTIADIGEGQFEMSVTVNDMANDLPVASYRASGRHPQDRSRVLGELLEAAFEHVQSKVTRTTPKKITPDFTNIPEVALLFFKGMEHYRNGHPEFAAEYFRHAYYNDPDFLLSAVWWMKSYEYLGLTAQVELLREHILARPRWRRVLPMLAATLAHQSGELVLSLRAADPTDSRHTEMQGIVSGAVREFPGIQLLSPEWITKFAAESGLNAGRRRPVYRINEIPWPIQDATIVVAVLPDDRDNLTKIQLQLVDSLSGAIVAQAERPSIRSEWNQTSRFLLEQILKGRVDSKVSYRALRPLEPLDHPLPPLRPVDYSIFGYAYLLRAFADDSTNPAKIAAHYEATRRQQSGVYPHIQNLRWPYKRLLLQALDAAIDESTPDASKWLSHTLWLTLIGDYYFENYFDPKGWFHGSIDAASLSGRFERLLDNYPDDFATLSARYAIAHTFIAAGLHEKAAALLLELAEAIPAVTSPEIMPHVLANLYFFTAREARKIGDTVSAKLYARKAMEQKRRTKGRGAYGIRPTLFYSSYSPPTQFVPGKRKVWYVSDFPFSVVEDGRVVFQIEQPLDEFIERQYNELNDKAVGSPAEPTLEQIYDIVKTSRGGDGVRARLNFIRKIAKDMARQKPVNGRFYFFILPKIVTWLKKNTPQDDLVVVRQEITKLFQTWRQKEHIFGNIEELEVDTYLALGMADEAHDAAQQRLDDPELWQQHWGIIDMTKVIRLAEAGAIEAAKFCDRQFKRYEKNLKVLGRELRTDYMDVLYACAGAYEKAHQPLNAAELYQYGIEQPIFDRKRRTYDMNGFRNHYIAALHYSLARMEERMGHWRVALSIYERVLALTEGHRDWFPYRPKHGLGGSLPLYSRALRRIENLRLKSQN